MQWARNILTIIEEGHIRIRPGLVKNSACSFYDVLLMEYFSHALIDNWSWNPFFVFFLIGPLRQVLLYIEVYTDWHTNLGPNKLGLVTYIQVNVYIGNTLSWLNGGWTFKTDVCWRLNNHIFVISLHIFKKQWFNILSLRLNCYIYWKFIRLYEHQHET